MPENPSFRYYMIAAANEQEGMLREQLYSLFPKENICRINEASFILRSKKHGQNAAYIYESLSTRLPSNFSFTVSSVAIRTLLGSNLPEALETWRRFESDLAKQNTFD